MVDEVKNTKNASKTKINIDLTDQSIGVGSETGRSGQNTVSGRGIGYDDNTITQRSESGNGNTTVFQETSHNLATGEIQHSTGFTREVHNPWKVVNTSVGAELYESERPLALDGRYRVAENGAKIKANASLGVDANDKVSVTIGKASVSGGYKDEGVYDRKTGKPLFENNNITAGINLPLLGKKGFEGHLDSSSEESREAVDGWYNYHDSFETMSIRAIGDMGIRARRKCMLWARYRKVQRAVYAVGINGAAALSQVSVT